MEGTRENKFVWSASPNTRCAKQRECSRPQGDDIIKVRGLVFRAEAKNSCVRKCILVTRWGFKDQFERIDLRFDKRPNKFCPNESTLSYKFSKETCSQKLILTNLWTLSVSVSASLSFSSSEFEDVCPGRKMSLAIGQTVCAVHCQMTCSSLCLVSTRTGVIQILTSTRAVCVNLAMNFNQPCRRKSLTLPPVAYRTQDQLNHSSDSTPGIIFSKKRIEC